MRTTFLKVGGSLLDLPDVGSRIHRLVRELIPARVILVPGGGETADLVRRWQPRFGLSDESAHELAVESLRLNAWLLMGIVPESVVIPDQHAAEMEWGDGLIPILAPNQFLAIEGSRSPDEALPGVWEVTSDSIAAWMAIRWPADELVLLKSTPTPRGQLVTQASAAGLVDPYFPGLAGKISRVSWCNLRSDSPVIEPWLELGRPV